MAYEFVEAFSSVFPRIRYTQILAVLGIVLDLVWRVATRNIVGPDFADIPAALLLGFYLGKRPPRGKKAEPTKSSWIRLS